MNADFGWRRSIFTGSSREGVTRFQVTWALPAYTAQQATSGTFWIAGFDNAVHDNLCCPQAFSAAKGNSWPQPGHLRFAFQ